MDHFVYIAASGANEIMLSQAASAHNLANASTPGFRADLVMAQTAYLVGEGHESRAYASLRGGGADFRNGVVTRTDRELDVAVNGDGWLTVLAPDGTEAYTRRGDLRVDQFGQLSNGEGLQIIGNAGPVALPPFSDLAIGADGTISIVPLGEDPNTLVVADRIKLVNPEPSDLHKNQSGLIQLQDVQPALPDASVRLISGSLESSNVNATEGMIEMIALARQFEMQMKLMETAEELDSYSNRLMRINRG